MQKVSINKWFHVLINRFSEESGRTSPVDQGWKIFSRVSRTTKSFFRQVGFLLNNLKFPPIESLAMLISAPT